METITVKILRNSEVVWEETYSNITVKTLLQKLDRDYCKKVREEAQPSFRPNWYIEKIILSDGKEIIPPEPYQLLQQIIKIITPAVALQEFPYPFAVHLQLDLQQLIKEFEEDAGVKNKVQEIAVKIRDKIMELWQDIVIPSGAVVIIREVWD